jgi:hypothetical protein
MNSLSTCIPMMRIQMMNTERETKTFTLMTYNHHQ